MRKVVVVAGVAVVLLALGVSGAGASPVLTVEQAKNAMRHDSLTHGMERAEVKRCWRLSRNRIRCEMSETGQWNEDLRAEDVWSLYIAQRTPGGVVVEWRDFAGDSCTTAPGYENQCPPDS